MDKEEKDMVMNLLMCVFASSFSLGVGFMFLNRTFAMGGLFAALLFLIFFGYRLLRR